MRPRPRLLTVAGLTASAATLVASGALATTSKTVTITDEKGDVDGALDIQGVSFKLAADGRLRAAVTVTQKIVPSKLLSETGPPGSVCLKIWTDEAADTTAMRSDRLVCVTAKSKTELRATILDQSAPGLPKQRRLRAGRPEREQAQLRPAAVAELARAARAAAASRSSRRARGACA